MRAILHRVLPPAVYRVSSRPVIVAGWSPIPLRRRRPIAVALAGLASGRPKPSASAPIGTASPLTSTSLSACGASCVPSAAVPQVSSRRTGAFVPSSSPREHEPTKLSRSHRTYERASTGWPASPRPTVARRSTRSPGRASFRRSSSVCSRRATRPHACRLPSYHEVNRGMTTHTADVSGRAARFRP